MIESSGDGSFFGANVGVSSVSFKSDMVDVFDVVVNSSSIDEVAFSIGLLPSFLEFAEVMGASVSKVCVVGSSSSDGLVVLVLWKFSTFVSVETLIFEGDVK